MDLITLSLVGVASRKLFKLHTSAPLSVSRMDIKGTIDGVNFAGSRL
jgi:hypothetical protein